MAQKILIKRATKTALENGKATLTDNEIIFSTDTKQLGVKTGSPNTVNYMAKEDHNHSAADINTGTLSVARGGTGVGTLTANRVLLGNGTSAITAMGSAGTAGQVLTSNGASAPTWQNPAAPSLTKANVSSALKTATGNIEIGENNSTSRNYSVVIGDYAQASNTIAVAIGRGSSSNQYSVGIGSGSSTSNGGRATGSRSVAIGSAATASATNSISIGYNVSNSTSNSVQIGNSSISSFKVGSYTVPLPTNAGTTGQILTKTSTGSSWQDAGGGGGETYTTKRTSLSFTKNSFDEKTVILSADFRFIEVSGLANSGAMANSAFAGFFLSREFLKEGAYFVFNGGNLYYHGETGANARKLSIYTDETNIFDTVIVLEHRYS